MIFFKKKNILSIDGHAIQIRLTGEPLEQLQFQQIPHKQNL